jgi:hypothetical protein
MMHGRATAYTYIISQHSVPDVTWGDSLRSHTSLTAAQTPVMVLMAEVSRQVKSFVRAYGISKALQ